MSKIERKSNEFAGPRARNASLTLPTRHKGPPDPRATLETSVQNLIDVCYVYGLVKGPKVASSIEKTVAHWLRTLRNHPTWNDPTHRHELVLKLLKVQLCSFFAWGVDSPQPVHDFTGLTPGWMLCGSVGRWLHALKMHCRSKVDGCLGSPYYWWIGFLHSLKMSKRCMPRPDKPMATRALCKTYKKLTTFVDHAKDFPSPALVPVPWIDGDTVVRFTADEVIATHYYCHPSKWTLPGVPPVHSVSSSTNQRFYLSLFASYVNLFVRDLDMSSLEDIDGAVHAPSRSATYSTARSKYGLFGDIALHDALNDVATIYQGRKEATNWEVDAETTRHTLLVDTSYEHAAYVHARDSAFQAALVNYEVGLDANGMKGMMNTSIFQDVIESLKVRTISKGPGALAFFLKPYQHALHRHLSSFVQFQNIGQPATTSSLNCVGLLNDDEFFTSVDYEASTDNLDQIWSETASTVIFDTCRVPCQARMLWADSLYGGAVRLSLATKTNGLSPADERIVSECEVSRRMVRGQLMGNIMSFPILCLANGFCLWLSRCVSTHTWLDPRATCYAVNGDDGVVRLTSEGYAFWAQLANAMGFPPSVGKVYSSKRFFDFNSECFAPMSGVAEDDPEPMDSWFHEDDEPSCFARIKFCHVGLVHGCNRTGDVAAVSELLGHEKGWSIGGIQRYLLSRAPSNCRLKVMELFYRHFLYNSAIYKYIRGLPFYLPPTLGGLGMQPVYVDSTTHGSWLRGEPAPVHSITLHGVHGQGKPILLGPSEIDLIKVDHLITALSLGEMRLPGRPKTVTSYIPDDPPGYQPRFSFDAPEIVDTGRTVNATWGHWHDIRMNLHEVEELQEGETHLEADQRSAKDAMEWCVKMKVMWKGLESRFAEPYVCLEGIQVSNPPSSDESFSYRDIDSWLHDATLAELALRKCPNEKHNVQVMEGAAMRLSELRLD